MKTVRERTKELFDASKNGHKGSPTRSWTSCMGQAIDEWQQSVEARLSKPKAGGDERG